MAADLTGMFAQLNKAIGTSPILGQTGKDLLTMTSQGAGGALSAAGGMLVDTAPDPMSFMTASAQ